MKNISKNNYFDTGYWIGNLKKRRFDKELANGILKYIENDISLVKYFYNKGTEAK